MAFAAGCASDGPYRTTFDDSAGRVDVTVLGDGFVRTGGERVPLEAFVLTMRQRTRSMSKHDMARFVVHLKVNSPVADAVKKRTASDVNRLLGELEIMGVKQVHYL